MSNRNGPTPAKTKQSKESRVSCRVPRALMNRLEKIAASNGLDVSGVVRMSLYRILPAFEKSTLTKN